MPAPRQPVQPPARTILGAEGGATRTIVLLANLDGTIVRRLELGPANLRLLSESALRRQLREMAAFCRQPAAAGLGLAGVRVAGDRERLRAAAARVWPETPLWVGNDLETALAAADPASPEIKATVLVISGTGACCHGKAGDEREARVGGWGHLLGDRGSGYAIGRAALRAAIERWDRTGRWPALGAALLRRLQFNEPEQLVEWSTKAGKGEVAALATEALRLAETGDPLGREITRQAAADLAEDALACARQLVARQQPVRFLLAGGVLRPESPVARGLMRLLRAGWTGARVECLAHEGALGAVRLAQEALRMAEDRGWGRPRPAAGQALAPVDLERHLPVATGPSPTEERNPRSIHLDRLPLREAVELMIAEEGAIESALRAEAGPIARAVRTVAAALRRGGRLFYVGAGTSGRLGVLDASECPPTFRTEPDTVQGIIAGGQPALWSAVEGAEDDLAAGRRAVRFRGVRAKDVVMGIAASGRTPFVWGALEAARELGARTVLLSFNPRLRFRPGRHPSLVICPVTGPEVLTGSTRLKAGTATKRVLNIITTLAMARLGKVAGNLMIDLDPTNRKLRERAVGIVVELGGGTAAAARAALDQSGWVIARALRQMPRPASRQGKGARVPSEGR